MYVKVETIKKGHRGLSVISSLESRGFKLRIVVFKETILVRLKKNSGSLTEVYKPNLFSVVYRLHQAAGSCK